MKIIMSTSHGRQCSQPVDTKQPRISSSSHFWWWPWVSNQEMPENISLFKFVQGKIPFLSRNSLNSQTKPSVYKHAWIFPLHPSWTQTAKYSGSQGDAVGSGSAGPPKQGDKPRSWTHPILTTDSFCDVQKVTQLLWASNTGSYAFMGKDKKER